MDVFLSSARLLLLTLFVFVPVTVRAGRFSHCCAKVRCGLRSALILTHGSTFKVITLQPPLTLFHMLSPEHRLFVLHTLMYCTVRYCFSSSFCLSHHHFLALFSAQSLTHHHFCLVFAPVGLSTYVFISFSPCHSLSPLSPR